MRRGWMLQTSFTSIWRPCNIFNHRVKAYLNPVSMVVAMKCSIGRVILYPGFVVLLSASLLW